MRRMEMHKCTDELERLLVVACLIYFDLSCRQTQIASTAKYLKLSLSKKKMTRHSSAFTAMMPSIQVGCGREPWYVLYIHRYAQ